LVDGILKNPNGFAAALSARASKRALQGLNLLLRRKPKSNG